MSIDRNRPILLLTVEPCSTTIISKENGHVLCCRSTRFSGSDRPTAGGQTGPPESLALAI